MVINVIKVKTNELLYFHLFSPTNEIISASVQFL